MEPLYNLSRDDFVKYSEGDIVASCDQKECFDYYQHFARKIAELQPTENQNAIDLFTLMRNLTGPPIIHDTPESPFGPLSLDDSQIQFLNEIIKDIPDHELRSRIADILYIHKPKDYCVGECAINAYLESSKRLEMPTRLKQIADRLERALQIVLRLGKQSKHLDPVVEHIENILAMYDDSGDISYVSAQLMKSLQYVQRGDATRNAIRAEKAALYAESIQQWWQAREYWSIKAEWHSRNKESEAKNDAKLRKAETYVMQAEQAANYTPPSYTHAANFINLGIKALRDISDTDTKKRVDELHPILLEYQQKSVTETIQHSCNIDISEFVEKAILCVKGMTLFDALYNLATICNPPKIVSLREQAEKEAKYLGIQLFLKRYLNRMGRTIAQQSEDTEQSFLENMFHKARLHWCICVKACIEPARNQIISEHHVRIDDFLSFVADHPLVRPGREYIVAHGLYSGLYGDYLVAVHLLVPQLEDSIRFLLSHQQVITSSLDGNGIQDEYNLNRMLSDPKYTKPLSSVLGEDFVFDMRGLLVEKSGDNLRNDMAHGLLSHGDNYRDPCRYFWWLMLHLYLGPISARLAHEVPENGSKDS